MHYSVANHRVKEKIENYYIDMLVNGLLPRSHYRKLAIYSEN